MNTHAQVRVERAIKAQFDGEEAALLRGDWAEVDACRERRKNLRAKIRVAVSYDAATAQNMAHLIRQLGPKDGLRRLFERDNAWITFDQLRAALALREHMNGASTGSAQAQERVDGGSIHNGQMEAMVDRRRPLRYALNAARQAVTDQKLMNVAIDEIILDGWPPRTACDRRGVVWGGQMPGRIMTAIHEALDAAAAHIGMSR